MSLRSTALPLVLLLATITPSRATAQSMVLWDTTYDGVFTGGQNSASGVAVDDATGTIVTTGTSWTSSSSAAMVYTVAHDASGQQLWSSSFMGPGSYYTWGIEVAIDSASRRAFVAVQSFPSTGAQFAVVAYDVDTGTRLWSAAGVPGQPRDMVLVADPCLIVMTGTGGSGSGMTVAYDCDGALQWTAPDTGAWKVAVDDTTGEIFTAAGVAASTWPARDVKISRISADGTVLGQWLSGEPGYTQSATDLRASDGRLFLVGNRAVVGASQNEGYVVGMQADGTTAWTDTLAATQYGQMYASHLEVDPTTGAIYVAMRESYADGVLLRVRSYAADTGVERWTAQYDPADATFADVKAIAVHPDGDLHVVGRIGTTGAIDGLHVTVSASGSIKRSETYDHGELGYDYFTALAIDPASGDILAVGSTDFAGGSRAYDALIVRYGDEVTPEVIGGAITDMVVEGDVEPATGELLDSRLIDIQEKIDAGKINAAISMLQELIVTLQDKILAGKIDADAGATLIALAQEMLDGLL